MNDSGLLLELSQSEEHEGWSFGLEDDNNFFKWNVMFSGPQETLYEVC
jgi:ubiquitin-protein ligase